MDDDPEWRTEFFNSNPYLDYYIIGGGEEPLADLIAWFGAEYASPDDLPENLVWMKDGQMRDTGRRPMSKKIDNIVSPYVTGVLDKFIDLGMVPLFETNRGCPFKCGFCAWGAASLDLLRQMDFATVLAEMDYVANRSSARNWILCDANFGILKRDIEIAEKIKTLKETVGTPQNIQTFVAKNTTDRNLEIGHILNDMTTATMSFQSLNPEVLVNIKRDNISLDTYKNYQKQFYDMGHRTYSELIIPMPGETRDSHSDALRQLIDYDVHELHVHNLRLLAGTDLNSRETREKFDFRSRFRLIHGDAGNYTAPDGSEIRAFEFEESLRETATMSEDDLFYFRRLQFFIELTWNYDVYGPLLKTAKAFGIHPTQIFEEIATRPELSDEQAPAFAPGVAEFIDRFEGASHGEWFDSKEDITTHFMKDKNFQKLIDVEYDKINIQFGLILLSEYKADFDARILNIIKSHDKVPERILDYVSEFTFARFPSLGYSGEESRVELPLNINKLSENEPDAGTAPGPLVMVNLFEGPKREEMRIQLQRVQTTTFSKIMNTQKFFLRNLKLSIKPNENFVTPLLYCAD